MQLFARGAGEWGAPAARGRVVGASCKKPMRSPQGRRPCGRRSAVCLTTSFAEDLSTPPRPRRARGRYSCFDHFGQDAQAYGYATSSGLSESCQDEVVSQLVELRRRAAAYASRDGQLAADEFFFE